MPHSAMVCLRINPEHQGCNVELVDDSLIHVDFSMDTQPGHLVTIGHGRFAA